MRRCEWIVRPPSKRRNRCLPWASTDAHGAARQALRPAVAPEARMRGLERVGDVALEHRPDAARRVVDRVALGHLALRVRADRRHGLRLRARPADQPGMRALMRRPSLLTKFSLLSLVVDRRPRHRGRRDAPRADRAPRAAGGDQARRDDDEPRPAADPAAGRPRGRQGRVAPRLARRAAQAARLRPARHPPPEGLQRRRRDRLLRRALDRRGDAPGLAFHPGRAQRAHRSQRPGDELRRRRRPPLARGLRAAAARRRGRAERRRRGLPPVRAGRGRRSPRTPAASTCCSRSACCCSTRACSGSSPSPPARCATRRCTTTSPTCPTARCSTTAWRTRWRPPSAAASRPRCC